MCDWTVDICPFVLFFLIDLSLTKMCDEVVSKDHFVLKYWFDRYKNQKICNKAADYFLPALKSLRDWLDMKKKKMLEKLDVLLSNDYVDLNDIDSDIVAFFNDDMELVTTDLNNISHDYDNFY